VAQFTVAAPAEQEACVNLVGLRASAVTSGLVAWVLAAAVSFTGCSAGQVAQTSTQEPAVNGTSATVNNVALRNVHLRAAQSTDFIQPGRSVELLFVATNLSPDTTDKLVSITSDIGAVTLTGDTTVPAGGVLIVGAPDGQPTPLDNVEAAASARATVTLAKPITNGLTYNFTFAFERAGKTTVGVPISAGEAPRRDEPAESGGHH
jgi:copper(I)-binding protein